VAPAELEAHLLTHPLVEDCAVVPVPDDRAGELPKAFVVRKANSTKSDAQVVEEIHKHVKDHKAPYKWLKGGVDFIDVIPKSPSGKILRRLLRDMDKQKREVPTPKL
jgi:acyl-coenzyme A synthetase/AMP-(fatty) acid ligase